MDKTLGENFIPESQELQVALFDATSFCTLNTVRPSDSISTANFSYGVIGVFNDSRLGKTSAGFATTFTPGEYGYTFEDGVTGFDSAFLVLDFSTTVPYGSGKDPMEYKVYEMSTIISDSAIFGITPGIIDSKIYPTLVNVAGTKYLGYDSTYAYIKLSNALLPKLFNVSSADTFKAGFKGLYVTVDTNVANGCIRYADLVNTSSSMPVSAIVAYYNTNDTTTKIFTYHVFNDAYSSTPRFNVYKHDYKALSQPNDVLYMQGLGGVATQLMFNQDSIVKWVNGRNIAVNRAELILPVEDSDRPSVIDEQYSKTMGCIAMLAGSYSSIIDMYGDSFGGNINRSQMVYSINITHTFNEALLKKKGTPTLIVPGSYVNDARSIFVSNKSGRKPQLKIWYGEVGK